MGEKWLKYVLIPIVFGIWAFVIYKYFLFVPESEVRGNTRPAVPSHEVVLTGRALDTFSLKGDYSDPFLGRGASGNFSFGRNDQRLGPQAPRAPSPYQPPQMKVAEKEDIEWGFLKYKGYLRETGREIQLGMLEIHRKVHMVVSGKSYSGVDVISLWADSVCVKYKGAQKTILKQ